MFRRCPPPFPLHELQQRLSMPDAARVLQSPWEATATQVRSGLPKAVWMKESSSKHWACSLWPPLAELL